MNWLLAAIRRLARLPGFERLKRFPPLLRLTFSLRGHLVKESLRFAINELRRGSGMASYHLSDTGVSICLRHHTEDIMTLDEIFSQRMYEFPPAISSALDRVAAPLEVVDLGANIGLFGAYVIGRYPEARISAFEPDPFNATVHSCCIKANGREETWRLSRSCAWNSDGSVPFALHRYALSRVTAPTEGPITRVPAVDVLPQLEEGVDLLKMDIEGSEWAILSDPRFAGVTARVIALEYHPHMCPSGDPKTEAGSVLGRAGYQLEHVFQSQHGEGMLWAWRPTG